MNIYIEKDRQLKSMYARWFSELNAIHPDFFGQDSKYSNPYYTAIPLGWFESDVRILCIGEEGYGSWGCGKKDGVDPDDFQFIQTYNWQYLSSNVCPDELYLHPVYKVSKSEKYNHSAFWKRVRALRKYGPCAWSNLDKIHKLGSHCPLGKKDRIKLHSTETKIIREEIEILKPTHVVFFGWYGISLKEELPDVFKTLYPKGLGDDSVWNNTVVPVYSKGIHYIAAYHPAWRKKPAGYEELVISELEKTLKQSINP